jgi:hypothetical protein
MGYIARQQDEECGRRIRDEKVRLSIRRLNQALIKAATEVSCVE